MSFFFMQYVVVEMEDAFDDLDAACDNFLEVLMLIALFFEVF